LAFTAVPVGDPVEAVKAIANLIKGKCDRKLCALNKTWNTAVLLASLLPNFL
jgi:hypothetical protein